MNRIFTGIAYAAFCILLSSSQAEAAQAAAVIDDGYAGKVLNKILNTGKFKFSQPMELRLSLDDSGHLLECQAVQGGDASEACAAAKAASPFGTPPYGVPTFVTLALWNSASSVAKPQQKPQAVKAAAQTAKQDAALNPYLSKIRTEIRNVTYIPEKTKPGTYHVTARIKCDSAGKIMDYSILKGSGDALLDKYLLQGIKRAGKVSPPPAGAGDSFDLTFTLVRN